MGVAAHWAFLDKKIYCQLNNLTLATANGTTQIDHVIVSRHGIFVIEAKNIDGWIFGDVHSPQWSIIKPGRKFLIQNPLHQNHRHVRAIVEGFGIEETKVHSLVMFWGDCEFKTPMPANVMSAGYATYIKSFTARLFEDQQVSDMVASLESGALPKTWETRQTHLASLQARHASTSVCAKCGSALVVRTARNGANVGAKFFGCSAYPKCRYTVPWKRDA